MQINHRSDLNLLLKEHKMLDNVAEIGVAEGRYSLEILNWGVKKLYLVDIWESKPFYGDAASPQNWHDKNFEDAKQRVSEFGNKVVFLKGLSVVMAEHIPDESLGMVYLDACHTYEAVLADLNAYLPKLKVGGIMAGHDFLAKDYGVEQAVREFAAQKGYEVNTIPEHSPENASFWFQKK
jgi:hypothetical protein